MLELIKLITDFFVLRDARQKSMLSARPILAGIAYAVLLYGIGVPAAVLYQKHPEDGGIFLAVMVFLGVLTVVFFFFAIRWYLRSRAEQRRRAQEETS